MKLIILCCFVLFTTTVCAQVYRYVDDKGKVVYSDTPPEGSKQTKPLELPEDISEKKRKEAEQELEQLLDTVNTEDSAPAQPEQKSSSEQEPKTQQAKISNSDQARIKELKTRIENTKTSRKGSRRKRRNRILAAESELGSIYKKYGMQYQSTYKGMGYQDNDEGDATSEQ